MWKAAGKPRSGSLYIKRQTSRSLYRKGIRDRQKSESTSYSNDLHDALMQKNGPSFWKVWRSKFESSNKYSEVAGCVDSEQIVVKFADYFQNCYTCNSTEQANNIARDYVDLRDKYSGFPLPDNFQITTEIVDKTIDDLKRGRAADLDGLTAEHLVHAHPALPVLLARLFCLIIRNRRVPDNFLRNYIVPVPKLKECRNKSLLCDDFRGIAISSIVSKVFEYCLLHRIQNYLYSDEMQFGFKKNVGCRDAIFTLRTAVDRLLKDGSTANLCSLDLSKAFDKVNHQMLYIKLMERHLPVEILQLLETWLDNCCSCVKWSSSYSSLFNVNFGVRQGSVLSPLLFAVYVDDVFACSSLIDNNFILLYADDILLIAPSVCALQNLLHKCENVLSSLDMNINYKKSNCLRIGNRYKAKCSSIVTSSGHCLDWCEEIRYLGMFIVSGLKFKCSLGNAKRSFYRAANAVLGKTLGIAHENVIIHLLQAKCVPILLYCLECVNPTASDLKSLDFVVNRFLMKLFKTSKIDVIDDIRNYFCVELPSETIGYRILKYSRKCAQIRPSLYRWLMNV